MKNSRPGIVPWPVCMNTFYEIKNNSWQIEDFVETHIFKLRVILRSLILRVFVWPRAGYTFRALEKQYLKLQNSRSVFICIWKSYKYITRGMYACTYRSIVVRRQIQANFQRCWTQFSEVEGPLSAITNCCNSAQTVCSLCPYRSARLLYSTHMEKTRVW